MLNDYKALITLRTLGLCIAPLLLFILNGLLTSKQKAVIVFWRFKNVPPGNRAFSIYAHQDDRISVNALTILYPKLPIDPKQQNQLWYKIYKIHAEEIIIRKSHKDFLLARDLTSLSFLFLISVGISSLFFNEQTFKWYYLLMLIIQYLIMVRLAQNNGIKFVKNVLAAESTK
ncbi:MAG: hypothetical protein WKF97_06375 [Chitinophagaceae bacterium]